MNASNSPANELRQPDTTTAADHHDMTQSDWEPGRWWRVTAPDGSLRCETSDEDEAREAMRPGDTLQRLWRRVEEEWRHTPA